MGDVREGSHAGRDGVKEGSHAGMGDVREERGVMQEFGEGIGDVKEGESCGNG